ncbi:MAG TPA: hypothetical protein VNL77_18795, partial [Roseiflexaceae bacterium]|nr:hypothetical protein [Roseiflexaceae bacterium]
MRAFDLDALCYYYHGAPGEEDERIQAGFIVGHSLLTARGIPCSGEGDLKTAVAMKICDTLGVGGSFSEIVVVDYEDETIRLGHDGPFHIAIAEGRPILRGMGLYHGKQGTGVSVEAKVRQGPVTTLNVTQTADGRLKLISGEGESTDGPTMQIGNTQTPVRFRLHPDEHMARWFAEAPTHHCALSIGHNAALFAKVAALLVVYHSDGDGWVFTGGFRPPVDPPLHPSPSVWPTTSSGAAPRPARERAGSPARRPPARPQREPAQA